MLDKPNAGSLFSLAAEEEVVGIVLKLKLTADLLVPSAAAEAGGAPSENFGNTELLAPNELLPLLVCDDSFGGAAAAAAGGGTTGAVEPNTNGAGTTAGVDCESFWDEALVDAVAVVANEIPVFTLLVLELLVVVLWLLLLGLDDGGTVSVLAAYPYFSDISLA